MVSEVCVSGVDLSFVLVVDLGWGNLVIGDCVFSVDLDVVVVFICVYVCGMYSVGMVVMFKYFFGYGMVKEDIYVDDVSDLCMFDEFCVLDLVLFVVGIDVGVDVVMMVYVVYLQVVLELVGYLFCWIGEILCGEMGFCGVVFFDDIGMVVLFFVGGVKVCVDVYLDVGCDVVLVCYFELVEELLCVVEGCIFNIVVLLGLIGCGVLGWDGLLVDICYGII